MKGKKLKVVTSIFPLKEIAQAVGGKQAEVELLLPPGAEPHTWEPKPSDIIRLSTADIFIYIGAGMEPWIYDILKGVRNPELIVMEASHGLTLIRREEAEQRGEEDYEHGRKHFHESEFDPHVWLDFDYAQRIVEKITGFFIGKNPDSTDYYQANAEAYKKKLQSLDKKYREALKECHHREMIYGGHAAFAYLVRRYGLKQISLYGISPDSEPTPKRLARIIEFAKRHRIRVIYFDAFVSDKLARAIARDVGAETLVLNTGANLTREQLKSGVTFLSMMEENLENLRYGLECR
ncbi:MAG: zinc ABC transporter substrate-binding protein [Nitrospirae bacterium]|nr:zinc ABC transporter substrate-binding protein [Nitrospirota bacterium]